MLKRLAPALAPSLAALWILAGSAGGAAGGAACYTDAVGDAGDAADLAQVTIRPLGASVELDVRLAARTALGPYGWILVGLDTDRNPFTGGGRGDELLMFTNGDGTTLTRWADGRFTPDFAHHRFQASFSGTDLTLTIARADVRARSFEFSVASLREEADLAPGGGVAAYPGGASHRCDASAGGPHIT